MVFFLPLGIGEECNILLTEVMAHHGKTGDIVFTTVVVYRFGEPPVHLESLSRLHSEPAATAVLWRHQLPLGGNKVVYRLTVLRLPSNPMVCSHSRHTIETIECEIPGQSSFSRKAD